MSEIVRFASALRYYFVDGPLAHFWHKCLCPYGIHRYYVCQWERINDRMTPVVVTCRYCQEEIDFRESREKTIK